MKERERKLNRRKGVCGVGNEQASFTNASVSDGDAFYEPITRGAHRLLLHKLVNNRAQIYYLKIYALQSTYTESTISRTIQLNNEKKPA